MSGMPELARSLMFVPGHRRSMVEKALGLAELDVALFDLEDGVPPNEREAARVVVAEALGRRRGPRPALFVRINPVTSDAFAPDVTAVARSGPDGIVLPKVQTAEDVVAADLVITDRAGPAGVPLLPSIETAKALLAAASIAAASAHVAGLMFGAEDFANDLGLPLMREGEARELRHARSSVVLAAAAAGVPSFDSVWPDIRDQGGLRRDAVQARELGFSGKTLIHPTQIAVVNEAFTPSEREAARARAIVAAFEEALRRGEGAIAFEGQLVDRPVAERARRVIRASTLARSQSR